MPFEKSLFMMDPNAFMTGLLAVTPPGLHLSTMTVLVKLDREVSLVRVADGAPAQTDFVREVVGSADAISIRVPKEGNRSFNNCLIFDCASPKVTVKVFCNGNLHITGARSTTQAVETAEVFATLFELIYGGDGVSSLFNVIGFDVQMINHHYKLPGIPKDTVISLPALKDALKKVSPYFVSYNNEHHAGVILKAPQYTIIVFESGNTIFTAITTAVQLAEAFGFFKGFMDTHLDALLMPQVPIKKRANKRGRTTKNQGFDYGAFIVLK